MEGKAEAEEEEEEEGGWGAPRTAAITAAIYTIRSKEKLSEWAGGRVEAWAETAICTETGCKWRRAKVFCSAAFLFGVVLVSKCEQHNARGPLKNK